MSDFVDAWLRERGERLHLIPAGACVGNCKDLEDLDCAQLAEEEKKIAKARERAALAKAAYEPDPAKRKLPAGYSNATDADLEALGLKTESGGNLLTIPDSQFSASAYRNDLTSEYVIAFKGTDSFEAAVQNVVQGAVSGGEYYDQAIEIGRRVAQSGFPVSYVGHSLGGGLASAAVAASNGSGTTFNASGLNPLTVPDYDGSVNVDAYYVRGDGLSSFQDDILAMPNADGRRIGLPPQTADQGYWDQMADETVPLKRKIRLHRIDEMTKALETRAGEIESEQIDKGCK